MAVPVLIAVLLLAAMGANLRGRAGDAAIAQPSVDFEALAGRIGRAEAWFQANGYGGAPPSAAVSSFWPQSTSRLPEMAVSSTITISLAPRAYLPAIYNDYRAVEERRAVWITRFDWTSLGVSAAPEKIDEMVANVAGAGFNTIFFQVRGVGDAFYTPGLEPWAARLSSGTVTEALGLDPGWDPLARMLDVAHAAGLEVHAYVNVYPAWMPVYTATYSPLAPPATVPPQMFDRFTYGPNHPEHPGEYGLGWDWQMHDAAGNPMLLAWNTYLWASPGVDAVQDYVAEVVRDIVTRYAVDGVHLDLVRYAGPMYSYDPYSNAVVGSVKSPVRDQWQRDRVTSLVGRVRAETHALRPGALVSAAVWPYYKNDLGLQTSSGYYDYYQDSKGWLTLGAVDAIAPMLYGNGSGTSIPDDLDNWRLLAADFVAGSAGRDVYLGIGGYYDDFAAIAQRIAVARALGAPGHAVFSYSALDSRGYWDDFAAGPYGVRE